MSKPLIILALRRRPDGTRSSSTVLRADFSRERLLEKEAADLAFIAATFTDDGCAFDVGRLLAVNVTDSTVDGIETSENLARSFLAAQQKVRAFLANGEHVTLCASAPNPPLPDRSSPTGVQAERRRPEGRSLKIDAPDPAVETGAGAPAIEATGENVGAAREFLLEKWRERAGERGREPPQDLSQACKFTSAFAVAVFGGGLRGNFFHQWCELADGAVLDLNDGAADVREMLEGRIPDYCAAYAAAHGETLPEGVYVHDAAHMRHQDAVDSMRSVAPRVRLWVAEFRQILVAQSRPQSAP